MQDGAFATTIGKIDMNEAATPRLGQNLASLTSLRAFAAIAVAIHHTGPWWAHSALVGAIAQVGYLGVTVFFVLSGFVLMWSFDEKASQGDFLVKRIFRIYPLHLVCLLFSLSMFVNHHVVVGGYQGTVWGTVANFLLLQDWVPGHPEVRQAWNGVSWTLSCELFFYLCAPFLFSRLLEANSERRVAALVCCVWLIMLVLAGAGVWSHWAGLLDFLQYHPLPRFLEFVAGAAGALMVRRGWNVPRVGLSLLAILIPVVIYCWICGRSGAPCSPPVLTSLITPGAVWLIMSLAGNNLVGKRSFMTAGLPVFLGESSFALYMTHAMFLPFFAYYTLGVFEGARRSAWMGEVLTLSYLISAIGLASLVHLYVEAPMRRYLIKRYLAPSRVGAKSPA